MTTIATLRPAPASRRNGPVVPAMAVAAQATAAPSGGAGSAAAIAWCVRENARIPAMARPQLEALAAEGKRRLTEPGLSTTAKARLHLVVSGAHGQLAKLGHGKVGNGTDAFAHVKAAFDVAPGLDWAATGYGRTVLAIASTNWAGRKLAETALGIDSMAEARRATAALAAFPGDPIAQLTRKLLATKTKDKAALKATDTALAAMPAAAVEAARKELGKDAAYEGM